MLKGLQKFRTLQNKWTPNSAKCDSFVCVQPNCLTFCVVTKLTGPRCERTTSAPYRKAKPELSCPKAPALVHRRTCRTFLDTREVLEILHGKRGTSSR